MKTPPPNHGTYPERVRLALRPRLARDRPGDFAVQRGAPAIPDRRYPSLSEDGLYFPRSRTSRPTHDATPLDHAAVKTDRLASFWVRALALLAIVVTTAALLSA